jgi:hypothetical protein
LGGRLGKGGALRRRDLRTEETRAHSRRNYKDGKADLQGCGHECSSVPAKIPIDYHPEYPKFV